MGSRVCSRIGGVPFYAGSPRALREAEIRVVLDGSRDQLEALAERQNELERLFVWHRTRAGEEKSEVWLSIFAFDVERVERPHPCLEVEASNRIW